MAALAGLGAAVAPSALSGCGGGRVGPVIVVGAGMAGAHCARRLADAGVDVTLYEASERILLRRGPPSELAALYRRWLGEGLPLGTRQRVRVALAQLIHESHRAEAIEVLHGRGPADLVACNELLAVEMIRMGGKAATDDEARALVHEVISSGKAARTFERLIEAQGGDPRVVADPSRLAVASEEVVVCADRSGIVQSIDTKGLGIASVLLGAGRQRAEDVVDHAVGLSIVAKSGNELRPGDALVKVHVHRASDADAIVERIRAAYVIGEGMPQVAPLHLGRIEA
jgi:hypothetical protein